MNSLKDVINLQKKQQVRQKQLKKEFVKRLTNRIVSLAKYNQLKFIYTVPSCLFGFSYYDVADITHYLHLYLKKEGFYVIIIDNDKLFISWDIKDTIKNTVTKNNKVTFTEETNKFINLRPLLNYNK